MTRTGPLGAIGAGLLTACLGTPALAVDYSFSGFGTLGYTRSNQEFAYQRFIDRDGTWRRDSVLGAQLDVRFDHRFGAMVQAKFAPSVEHENRDRATVSWAFLSYRPNNDWLLRLGRLRAPVYLHLENMDVGATFDEARLPAEMYLLVPTTDVDGASVSRSWALDAGDLTLDAYKGRVTTSWRFFSRDSTLIPRGPAYQEAKVDAQGMALTLRGEDTVYRASAHHIVAHVGPFPRSYPFVPLGPGAGYYRISEQFPGTEPMRYASKTSTLVFTAGLDVGLPGRFRLSGEMARRIADDAKVTPDTLSGYLSVRRRFGSWTPYLTYAFLKSKREMLDYYKAVNSNRVGHLDPADPMLQMIDASQRLGADGLIVYDQHSWALGASKSLSPTSKLKAEWQRVHIGEVSSMVDAPAGGDIRHRNINIFSASYNFVF